MKRLIFIAFMVAAGAFIISCNTDGKDKANLRFTNSTASQTFNLINWQSGSATDKSWTGNVAVGASTAYQETEVLTGTGEGFDVAQGQLVNLLNANGNAMTLTKDTDNTYEILSTSKK